jgi:hypothetical protein
MKFVGFYAGYSGIKGTEKSALTSKENEEDDCYELSELRQKSKLGIFTASLKIASSA